MNLIVYNLLKIISNSDASCVQCRQQKKVILISLGVIYKTFLLFLLLAKYVIQ